MQEYIILFKCFIVIASVIFLFTSASSIQFDEVQDVPILTTMEEIQNFKAIPTIQYSEPIGPVRN